LPPSCNATSSLFSAITRTAPAVKAYQSPRIVGSAPASGTAK